MKKTTKLFALLLAAVMTLGTLVACGGGKTAITAEAFKTAAEAAGMTVEDALDSYSNVAFATDAKVATHPDGWKIVFLTMDNAENAHSYLNTMKSFIEGQKTGAGSSQTTIRDTWGYYSQTNGGMFSYVCQIDNTMLYVPGVYADSYKDAIQAVIKTLGY